MPDESQKSRNKTRKPTFTEKARRRQILEVALELFKDNGYDGTSVAAIAKRAEVSRGVIFYYFDGKRQLGEEVIRHSVRKYSRYVLGRVEKKRTPRTKLIEFVDACLDYIDDHPEDYRVYMDTIGCFGSTKEKNDIQSAINQRTREILVGLIKEGQARGELAKLPVNATADIIQGVIDGLQALASVQPDTVSLPACKKLLRKMFTAALEPA